MNWKSDFIVLGDFDYNRESIISEQMFAGVQIGDWIGFSK